jgi:hypothetical protein
MTQTPLLGFKIVIGRDENGGLPGCGFGRICSVHDVHAALADPFTRARVDGLIENLRTRGVSFHRMNIITALTNADLEYDTAALLAEAVLARVEERVQPSTPSVKADRRQVANNAL